MEVYKTEVIITKLTRRGSGKDLDSPIRIITEVWTLDGEKIAEYDPCDNAKIKAN